MLDVGWVLVSVLVMSQHGLLFYQVSKRKRGPAIFCNMIAYMLLALPYSVDLKQVVGPVHIQEERITQGLDPWRGGGSAGAFLRVCLPPYLY